MAHIRLDIGADRAASLKSMREDLAEVVRQLNAESDKHKIKLSLDMASWDKEVSKIKSDINEVRKSFAGTNTATGLGIKATNITGEIKPALSAIEQFNQRIKKIGVDDLDEGRLLNLFSSIGDALREDKVLADNFCEAVNKTYGVKYLEHLIFAVQRYSQNITTATELSKEFDSITNRQFTTEIPALATVDEQSINQLKALRSILRKSDIGWDDPYSKKKFSTYQASSTQLLSAIEQHATSAQLKGLGLQRGLISLSDVQGVLRSLAVNTGAISYNDGYGLDTFKTNSTRIREAISAHKEYEQQIASDNAALSELRNALVSTFGELPSEGGALVVTLDQLKQVESEAPAAMEYISQIQRQINGGLFKQEQSPAPVLEEVKTSVDQVVSSEQSLESATETVKGIFGSGINAEALNEQLNTISASISNASNAMGALGLNEESLNSFRAAINEIVELINQLIASVEKVNTTVPGLAPRDIVNRDSLEQAVATVNEATQATQVLGNTMGATASRAQEVTKAAQDVATATRGNVAASNELNTSISNLGTTMQAIEDTRIQEIANAELLREAQAEEEAYTNRANTALQNQIDMMLGIGRETKSAEQSMEAFIAAEDEANRTFQNIRTAEPQLKRIADAATRARAVLNSNMEASDSPSYQKAITSLERLEIVMEECGTDAGNLHRVLRDTGINSSFEIERLNSAVSTLKNELLNTGAEGSVSLRNIIDTFNKMQTRLNKNPMLSSTDEYSSLVTQVESFRNVINNCANDESNLLEVMRRFGLDGAAAIENARMAMSRFDSEVIATAHAREEAIRTFKNPEAADAELKRITQATASARRFLSSNIDASTSSSYQRVVQLLSELDRLLKECGRDSSQLAGAIATTGVNSTIHVNYLNTAVATLRDELQKAGTGGTTSLRAIIDMLNQMQSLVGENLNVTGGQGYTDINAQIKLFQAIIQNCKGDVEALEQVLHTMGLKGSDVIENARLAMSKYKSEVIAATTAEKANADAKRNSKTSYDKAKKAIEKYYSLVREVSRTDGDVTRISSGWVSQSGENSQLASSLNSAEKAYAECTNAAAANARTREHNIQLEQLEIAETDKLARSLEVQANKARPADETEAARRALMQSTLSTTNRAADVLRDYQHVVKGHNETSRQAYEILKRQKAVLDNVRKKYESGTASAEDLRKAQDDVKTATKEATETFKANGEHVSSLGTRIKGLATKFMSWLGVSQVIMYAVRAIKKMISASIEIEAAMTQLKIVTNATDSEMKQFSNTAITLAKNLGKSVTELTKSIETFSRLGYSLKDASELAKYATIMSNVAGVGNDEATTGITSIVKGFNLNVSDAEHVADVLVDVGQKYAVSAGELMEAYEKSGAALSATNTSLEKSAGLIAAANASVQDASIVGKEMPSLTVMWEQVKNYIG